MDPITDTQNTSRPTPTEPIENEEEIQQPQIKRKNYHRNK